MVRIVYDTFAIQTITMNGMFQILASSILLVGMFIVMIKIDVTMTLIALGVIPMLVILIASVSGTIDRLASEARVKESALYTVAHRALASIHVVQAFTREAESYREFVRSSSESLGENLRLYTFQSVYAGGVSVVIAIGTALVMYFGALHVMSARADHRWADRFHLVPRVAVCADQPDFPDLRAGAGREGGPAPMPRTARDRSGNPGPRRRACDGRGCAARSNFRM